MNKGLMDRFINKYNLSGKAESVKWEIKDKKVSTRFQTDDKHALGIVILNDFDAPDAELNVFNTAQLKSLLPVLADEIKISYTEAKNKGIAAVNLSDDNTSVRFVLASPNVIPEVPTLKNKPAFEVEIPLDDKFSSTFIKAKNALPDVDTCTILSDGKDCQVVIGYSTQNTTRVSIKSTGTINGKIAPIDFMAQYLKDILSANKESIGTLKVSSKGLAHISFKNDEFKTDYYLVQVQTAD